MGFLNFNWMTKLCLGCFLLVNLNSHAAMAADYFLATNGNDGNRGTIQQPFKTLERAVKALASGDRLLIRGGTYRGGNGDNNGRLDVPSGGGSWERATTIKAYNNEKVIITPYDRTTYAFSSALAFYNYRSWIIVDGLIIDGVRHSNGQGAGGNGIRLSWNGHHFRIINTEIRNMAIVGIQTTNAHSNEFINLKIHHNNHGFPSGHKWFNSRVYGIYMSSENNLVMGCEIHHNRGHGISNYSGHDFKPNNNTYIGNRFYANERSGIVIGTSTGVKLINNLSYGNGTGAMSGYTGWDRWGIQIGSGGTNVAILNNTTYGNPQGELMLGPRSANVIVRNNILTHKTNQNALLIYKGSTKSVIENNLIAGSGSESSLLVRNWESSATLRNNLIGNRYNPKFISLQNHNFHLTAESPARGIGKVLDEVKTDFDGVPRTLADGVIGAYGIDAGAFQYVK